MQHTKAKCRQLKIAGTDVATKEKKQCIDCDKYVNKHNFNFEKENICTLRKP